MRQKAQGWSMGMAGHWESEEKGDGGYWGKHRGAAGPAASAGLLRMLRTDGKVGLEPEAKQFGDPDLRAGQF